MAPSPVEGLTLADFCPGRLTLARQRRGMTKAELATHICLSAGMVSLFESGKQIPTNDTIDRLIPVLQFPRSFFYAPPLEEIDETSVSFRSMRSISARLKEKMLAASSVASGLISPHFRSLFRLPALDLPDLNGETPEAAAEFLREHWQLGGRPISNMVHLLESKGVEVYWLNEPSNCLDAVSFRRDELPFVTLNLHKKAGERGRFDAAHELGHLVLHRQAKRLDEKEVEQEAHRFASAFLLPEAPFREMAPRLPTLTDYFPLKSYWKVSIQAMVRRSKDLGIITPWHYEVAFKEIGRRRWRAEEPNPLERERSRLHALIYDKLAERRVDAKDFAARLGITPPDLLEQTPEFERLQAQVKQPDERTLNHLRLVRGGLAATG